MVKGTWRRGLVLALVLLALGAGAAGAQAAASPAQSLVAAPADFDGGLTAGADGGLWGIGDDNGTLSLDRFGATGAATRLALPIDPGILPNPAMVLQMRPTPLADGSMAVVVTVPEPQSTSWPGTTWLVRAAAGGTSISATKLPAQAQGASGFVAAPDGTLWFASTCTDALYRVAPGGRLTQTTLPSMGCGDETQREAHTTLVRDGDGTIWLVDVCQGRVVRIGLDGAVRQWRPQAGCDATYHATPLPEVQPDRRGGIVFAEQDPDDGEWYGAGHLTANGRLQGLWLTSAFTVAADGAIWTDDGPLARPLAGKDDLTFGLPAQARDGSMWGVGDHLTVVEGDKFDSESWSGSVATDRSTGQTWPVPVAADATGAADATLAPDGAIVAPIAGGLLRILPPGVGAPRRPTAKVVRQLTRVGRTVWLQLSCAADRGRFCGGTVTLASASRVVAPAPFLVAGQSRGAVALQLSAAAARALHRGSPKVTVRVTSSGAPLTRATITIPGMRRAG